MGGRLDATNVIDHSIMSIITSISIDHTNYLGPSLSSITLEKCGIIKKSNVCCIVSHQEEEAMDILERYTAHMQIPIHRCGKDWHAIKKGASLKYGSANIFVDFPLPSLEGEHQISNAGNAIAAANVLAQIKKYDKISFDSIRLGLTRTTWPARLQKFESSQFNGAIPTNWDVFLDGAHNVGGAQVLSKWMQSDRCKNIKLHLILGMTKGKDVTAFLLLLQPYVASISFICVTSEIESYTTTDMLSYAANAHISAQGYSSLEEAIEGIACKYANDQDSKHRIVICGSLFISGDLFKSFHLL